MKRSQMLRVLIVISLSLASFGCLIASASVEPAPSNNEVSTYPSVPQWPDSSFVAASQNFALDMLRQMNKESKDENLIFSPMSIQWATGMLRTAADADTAKAINKAWHLKESASAKALNTQLGRVYDSVQFYTARQDNSSASARMQIANALFVSPRYKLSSAFLSSVSAYKPKISTLDFTRSDAITTVNKWASDNTNGHIPKIIDRFTNPKTTSMIVLNAVAFEGRWQSEFDPTDTKKKTFYGTKGKTTVDMMERFGRESLPYYEDKDFQAVCLPYQGSSYEMFVILPRSTKAGALDALIKKLDGKTLDKIGTRPEGVIYEGTLYLPRFSADTSNENMIDTMRALGVNLRYDPDTRKANFNAAVQKTSYGDLYLGQFIHKAMIEVDEKGTVAAAVSLGEMVAYAVDIQPKPFVMNVNRPFIFGIRDHQGQIFFLGTVKNIGSAK